MSKKNFFTDTDDYARVALPTGEGLDGSDSNGDTSDVESVAESEEHHADAMSVGSAELI